MRIVNSEISAVKVVSMDKHSDERGSFAEAYHYRRYAELGIHTVFVQDNHSHSKHAGTIRGLHFQTPPFVQDKLVRVIKGAVYDVAVDLRKASPTYCKYVGIWINAEVGDQVFVPGGFAHGFCTMEPDTEVIYKVSQYYAPACDAGVAWNDPDLNIEWPKSNRGVILSKKDQCLPRFRDIADSLPF